VVNDRDRFGLSIDGFDGQIAAICRATASELATRNGPDFEHTGIPILDPWKAGS
jgi:predicted nucleic acid-binding protein